MLIVEDLATDRELYRRALSQDSSYTYHLLEAESVAEALTLCRTKSIDTILLDDALPDGNGLTFLAALTAQSNGSIPPVVMVTEMGDRRIAVRAMKLGAEDYLVKYDLTPELLRRALRMAIENARLRLQLQQCNDAFSLENRDRFFNLSIDLLAIANFDGYFLRLNPAWEETLGFTIAELMAQPYLDLVHPDDRTATLSAAQELSTGRTATMFENRYRCKDGSYRWLAWNSRSDDEQSLVYAVARDISLRKQTEISLQIDEELFRHTFEYASVGLAHAAIDGTWIRVNHKLCEILGYSSAELLATTFQKITEPADLAEDVALVQQLVSGEINEYTLEKRYIHKQGHHVWANLTVTLIRTIATDGQLGIPQYFISAIQDITARKQAQADLEQRNQELDSFVYVVSHDLKAPLRGIANLSKWIEEDSQGSLSTANQQQMTLLRSRVYKMEATIDGLLDYARIGSAVETVESVSIAELLADVIDSIAPPPTFTISLPPELPILSTQRLPLFQVFANLIGNGIKHHHSEAGSIQISIEDRGDCYEFAVSDDGSGIAPEHHDRIFTIFQAVNPQNRADSTGIGLAIVIKIIESQGGRIWLDKDVKQGARFCFTWLKIIGS